MIRDEDKLLVSDELSGVMDDTQMFPGVILVILTYHPRSIVNTDVNHIVGSARSVLLGDDHEVEFRVSLDDAMALIAARDNITVDKFELKSENTTHVTEGPFKISAARISDIHVTEHMCTLGVLLKRTTSNVLAG